MEHSTHTGGWFVPSPTTKSKFPLSSKIALVIDIEAKQLKFEADFTTSATVQPGV
jgi:hypothetical protein